MLRSTASGGLGWAGIAGAMILSVGITPIVATAAQAEDCSGILCMFSSKPAEAPAPAPQPAPAAQPQPADASAVAAEPAASDDAPPQAKPRPRPLPVVTIAADPAQVARLKALTTVMPKARVKIETAGKAAAADFAVTTSVEEPRGVEAAKLFTETLHVVAGTRIHSLADLDGKVVSFGAADGASRDAARKAFEALNIKVTETPLDLDNALDGLATGDIDAVVLLSPQPDERLRKVAAPGLHLVAWPQDATLPDGAVATSIDVGAYPGLGKSGDKVAAVGVDAVLTLNPKGRRLPTARAFLGALSQHSATLSRRGFDLLKADLDARAARRVANAETR